MHSTLIKRSGLDGIKKANPMPLPSMINKPIEEIKAVIKHRNKMFKPV